MGAREFALMKPGAIFINGARGAIVQETALLDALDSGHAARRRARRVRHRAAAARLAAAHPSARSRALPHIGSATHETRHAMAELATTNLLQALAGERPANAMILDQP